MLLFAFLTAAVLGAALPVQATSFSKVSDGIITNITIDWGAENPPVTSDCIGNHSDADNCNSDPQGRGRVPNATGDADACGNFRWNTGHGNTGGIYSAVKHDGAGPRGEGRSYWAVCVKDKGNATAGADSLSVASAHYYLDLAKYVPEGQTIQSAQLSLDYTADTDALDGNSSAVLYGFIKDLDTGLYYKIRGDQSAGNAAPGSTDEDLSAWRGCDYLDVWSASAGHRWRDSRDGSLEAARNSSRRSGYERDLCEPNNGSAKTAVAMETSLNRTFGMVCGTGAPNLTLGYDPYPVARCYDTVTLADILKGKATATHRFELWFQLAVRTNPGAGKATKFALAFDDPIFIKTGTPNTPRYGASFSYGSTITLACDGAASTLTNYYAQDHNKFAAESNIGSNTSDANGHSSISWTATSPVNGIDYMTGFWIRCSQAGQSDAYTKIYLINKDPEVYLRGRAYYTYLPCLGTDVSSGGTDCTETKGNGEASTGDHAEKDCHDTCDVAHEPGKQWVTIKLGKRGVGGYATSRQPISGSGGTWGENDLAQAGFLGCTTESSCASENTATSFRLAQEAQQGDNFTHCNNDDLNGDGVPDLTPHYNANPGGGGGSCESSTDATWAPNGYARADGRLNGHYSPDNGGGSGWIDSLTGSDSDTRARVVSKCWSEQPPTHDGNGGSDSHPQWLGGANDCEFMQGRWAKFLFGAANFRGDGTSSIDTFWWTVGLWLDDKHVVALGQHTSIGACAPSQNTDHDQAIFFISLGFHPQCMPNGGVLSSTLPSPTASTGIKIWLANTVQGCDTWTNCAKITDLTDYVNKTVQMWNRLTSNLLDDLANFSETYPNDGGATSITALGTHFLKVFGEPANNPATGNRYVQVGGGACSTVGVAMTPPTNPGGIFYNLLRTSIASNHPTNDPFSIGVQAAGNCVHAAIGDLRPPLRDGAALTLPTASALLQDKRDQWFIRMNHPQVRPVLDGWFQNITTRYAAAIGPSNGSNGLNYFLKGVVNADPKAWSDALDAYLENGRDFKFFGGVVLNEQMARAFNPVRQAKFNCQDTVGTNPPQGNCYGSTAWGNGVNATANNISTIAFLSSAIDLVTSGLQQYNLLQKRMNDLNPAYVKANAEAKWGFTYWFLKFFNTFLSRMPQDRFNASIEEKTRWISIANNGNPGYIDYLGTSRGTSGGCGNWVYQRSAHTTSDPNSDDNDLHNHDATAFTDNNVHPMQYRKDVSIVITIEAGNPIKQDAGYSSIDSGMNYLFCRLQYVNDESYKNLADTLLETVGQAYKSYYYMTRYGQNSVPAIGQEPTVSDFSTQLIQFITQWLDYYRVRPTRNLYDNGLLGEQQAQLAFPGNNDYYFNNVQQVVINGQNLGTFSCNSGAASAIRCRDRYFYEKEGYNLFLYKVGLKVLDNIDFGPTGAFYNLTKLRVERAADLAGDPQGAQNGLTYALNYGRNVLPSVRQKFAQTLTDYIPLYLRAKFDAADQDQRLTPQQRLDFETARTRLQTFAARWFGDWGDLMFSLRGLRSEYYNCAVTCSTNPFPEPFYVLRTDSNLTLNWGTDVPDPVLAGNNFSARWISKLNVFASHDYRLQYCRNGGGMNLTVDSVKASPTASWTTAASSMTCLDYNVTLSSGLHDILVEYYHNTSGTAQVDLRWNLTSATCANNVCESITTQRYYPPYPYDYTFKAAGALRWIFALFNTLYESFTPTQNTLIAKAIAQNAVRYFGDADGCSGKTASYHTQIGRQNSRCASPPLTNGIDPSVVREQHSVTSKALDSLFKGLGLALQQLPQALPDPSSTTDEGIVFLTHLTEAAKNVINEINNLPSAQKNITYDRYWASTLWGYRAFKYFTDIAGAGVLAGPIKVSATPGQIGAAGADLASNLDLILGDPQARSGLNYLMTSLRTQDEAKLKTFDSNLISVLQSFVLFNSQRAIRLPSVFTPNAGSDISIQEYNRLGLYQKANGTLGLRYLLDPINQIQGLWGKYYDFRTLAGRLYVGSDDGATCSITTADAGVGTNFYMSGNLNDVHPIFFDYDRNGDRWDYSADVSSGVKTGPNLVACHVRNAGGNAGFDAALKVGPRFRIHRSDDDANYHATIVGAVAQIPGCQSVRDGSNGKIDGGSYCYTKNYDCTKSEVWRYSTSQPGWWPAVATVNINDEITTQDLTDGTAAYAPFASTAESWGCTNAMPTGAGSDFYVWKRIDLDPFEEGTLMMQRADPNVNFCFGNNPPNCDGSPDPQWLDSDNFAVRWTGKINVPSTRTWTFQSCAGDGVRLYLDGVSVIDSWVDVPSFSCRSGSVFLEGGLHDIQLDYYERTGIAQVDLEWDLSGCCQVVDKAYLYTRDPAQYNRSAQSFFGIVYGTSGALNALWALASQQAIRGIFDTMSNNFPEYWGSFGGVYGRSYETRYSASNASLDPLRDDYSRGILNTYSNLLKLAGKVGEQALLALPNASSAGFLRMWDFPLPASLSATEKNDLCSLAASGLSSSARRYYYFGDDNWPESWTGLSLRRDVGTYINTSCAAGPFTNITNADALRGYMLNTSADSVIVMLKDVCPDTVCDTPWPNAVIYYDPTYPTSWIGTVERDRIAAFFNQSGYSGASDPRNPPGAPCSNQSSQGASPSAPCGRNFTTMNAAQLAVWMRNMTAMDRARGSVAVFSQDVCPNTVCQNMTVNNTIAKYLQAGGRVVWPGDIPFYYQGLSGGSTVTWGTDGSRVLLGVDCLDYNGTSTGDCFPAAGAVSPNPNFAKWGMTQGWSSNRPVSYRVADSNFTGRYWSNSIFSGNPTFSRPDSVLDFWFWRNCPQWAYDCDPPYTALRSGAGSPDRSLPLDSFSSEWTGSFYQTTNNAITFVSNGDDSRGVRVDGGTIVDPNNVFGPPASCVGDTSQETGTTGALSRGFHTVIFRQCEASGDAAAQLTVYGSGWPGTATTPWGLKSVVAVTPLNVFAHHGVVGGIITNISGYQKNFNPVFPDSGFVRVWDCQPGSTCGGWDITNGVTDPHLRDLWNVSTYNLTTEVHGGELSTGSAGGAAFRVPDINMAGNDTTLLNYIRSGGRVVWIGDVPMYNQGHKGTAPNAGNLSLWDYGGEKKVLGVRTADAYGSTTQSSLTWEGRTAKGLGSDASVTTDDTRRPAYLHDLTYTYRKDSRDNASWWLKDFNDSIVSYKRRTTEFRTHVLEGFSMFLNSLDNVGDWERKITTYWADKYWVQVGAIASYKSWLRQSDLLRQMGTDLVNSTISLIGKNESQGIAYIWRAELSVDWTAGRAPWTRALLNYENQNFGLLAHAAWNNTAGFGGTGLGVNTTLRGSLLQLNMQSVGSTGVWTGVGQP